MASSKPWIVVIHDPPTVRHGHGHEVRSKALSSQLLLHGAGCVTTSTALPESAWAEPNAVVFDVRRPYPVEYIDDMRRGGVLVATIDDDGEKAAHCDLVFNGPEYCCLRREFAEEPMLSVLGGPLSVLLAMGGSDPARLAERCQRVLGDVNAPIGAMRRAWGDGEAHQLYLDSDIVVASMGMSAYEAAACARPTVLLSLTEEHEEAARKLDLAGCAFNLGVHDRVSDDEIWLAVDTLLRRPDLRAAMGRAGRELVDGQGAQRVAREIVEALEGRVE